MSATDSPEAPATSTPRNHFRHKSHSKAPAMFCLKSSGPQIALTALSLGVGYAFYASQVPNPDNPKDNVAPTPAVKNVEGAYSSAGPASMPESEGKDQVKPGGVTKAKAGKHALKSERILM